MELIDYRSVRPICYDRSNVGQFPEKAIIDLSLSESDNLAEAALKISANPYKIEEQESFISEAKKLTSLFSTAFVTRVRYQLQSGFGAVLITGLPRDPELPATPRQGGSLVSDYKKTFVSEAMLLALGKLTESEPFNFRQEGRGTAPLIDNIVPVPELKAQKGAGGFDNNFPFHCESAWHRKRPDYLILLGVREEPEAQTLIFSAEMLENTKWLKESHIVSQWFRLKAPELYTQMEKSGIPMGTAKYFFKPPIEINDKAIRLNINFNGTDCVSSEAVKWLGDLEEFIEMNAVGTVIAPGNALILNNYKTCHTRTGYNPSFKGNDRWFLRGYFKENLWSDNFSSNQVDLSSEKLQSLIHLGWMTSTKRLTNDFLKYIYHPEEVQQLDSETVELAGIAFHYTPIENCRIV
jgi:L-asparagine oxygenase